MQFISLAVLGKRIKAIPHMMKDKSVSFWKKALVVLGLIYLILPVDLIPPIIPVFGFLDDIILWLFILDYLKDELDRYWEDKADPAERVRETKKKYRGKNIVDGVEYEVWEDEPDRGTQVDAEDAEGTEGQGQSGGAEGADGSDGGNHPGRDRE